MALSTLTTPGVYVQEISTLPPSVAPVSTAVPAFIGYTEKGPKNTPTRITSLIEFEATFGGAFKETYNVSISSAGIPTVTPSSIMPAATESPYQLYYHLQMYFGNGGGPCHIISVDKYNYTSPAIVATDFYVSGNPAIGIGKAEKVDEVTLLVAPEVILLSNSAEVRGIYDAMLAQCENLKDRFAIVDVKSTGSPSTDGTAFRNTQIGANSLKYGAAYYPPLATTLTRRYSIDEVVITADSRPVSTPSKFNTAPNNRLASILQGNGTSNLVTLTALAVGDTLTITVNNTTTAAFNGFSGTGQAAAVVDAINAHPVLSLVARAQFATTTTFYVVVRSGTTSTASTVLNVAGTGGFGPAVSNTAGLDNSQDIALGNAIKTIIADRTLTLAPSATMAGIYSAVDNDRGVWKAPANVGIANIVGPSFQITEAQQGGLNVDPTGGKSINAIRTFTGRGTLVWGSRTLDGNSNEWRYVPVRRLFIFVEESVKKASEFVVFEPNDKNTWLRVKGTITNFLTDLWKQGALAGSKPEDAFFVQAGLGETMTAQDILEGKLIVRVGMAAVRPAEFIVLQFVHKLQEA